MARTIPMPSKRDLPDGPRRDFVEEMRRHWRDAGRPPLRKVRSRLEGREDLKEATASEETIRRMLTGGAISPDLDRVRAVFRVLCEMADTDPDGVRWEDRYGEGETNWECLRRLWDLALDEGPKAPAPQPSRPRDPDPWASESDDPPF